MKIFIKYLQKNQKSFKKRFTFFIKCVKYMILELTILRREKKV